MPTTPRRTFLRAASALAGSLALGCRATSAAPQRPRPADPATNDAVPFIAAVTAGDLPQVRAMLSERPTVVNAVDEAGRSALVLAYLSGHETVAQALLEHSPELGLVEAVMIPDWTRAEAAWRDDPLALDAWHPVGGTPLYAAARRGVAGLGRLQDWGADPNGNPRGSVGVTPLYGALQCAEFVRAWKTTITTVSSGADVNAPQRNGDSPLHLAARRGEPELIVFLLRRGADPTALDSRGRTPLEHALRADNAKAAAILRSPAAVPRDDDSLRLTYDASGGRVAWPDTSDIPVELQTLVTGASHGRLSTVRAKVQEDARLVFSTSAQGEVAVEACGHVGNREILAFHLDRGAPMSVCTSIAAGALDRTRALLAENPGSVHERGPHDYAAMWYPAIGGGNVEAAEILLDHGCPVDQESFGTTGLHWAVLGGHRDLVAYLVDNGADVNAVGRVFKTTGQTPLAFAEKAGRTKIAGILKDAGAT